MSEPKFDGTAAERKAFFAHLDDTELLRQARRFSMNTPEGMTTLVHPATAALLKEVKRRKLEL